jgi:hypothetical protein
MGLSASLEPVSRRNDEIAWKSSAFLLFPGNEGLRGSQDISFDKRQAELERGRYHSISQLLRHQLVMAYSNEEGLILSQSSTMFSDTD